MESMLGIQHHQQQVEPRYSQSIVEEHLGRNRFVVIIARKLDRYVVYSNKCNARPSLKRFVDSLPQYYLLIGSN